MVQILYRCNGEKCSKERGLPCSSECEHTRDPKYAINKKSVEIAEEFLKLFKENDDVIFVEGTHGCSNKKINDIAYGDCNDCVWHKNECDLHFYWSEADEVDGKFINCPHFLPPPYYGALGLVKNTSPTIGEV